jgi:hypothetical protein
VTRQQLAKGILTSEDLPREIVDVPWDTDGEKICVRALSLEEIDRLSDKDGNMRQTKDTIARALTWALVDEHGEPIFGGTKAEADQLAKHSAPLLGRLFAVAMKLSSFEEGADERAAADFDEAQPDESVTG